jgi:class 3 adenylate cyclase/tetratricopeptide (TPR) repeat protein
VEAPDGEHKQVTVLCGALAETPALAVRLEPEAMYHLMREVLALVQDTVQHYEGMLLQVSGEGFVALFGAPVAQEDHARRAVLAALEVSQRLRALDAVQGQAHGIAVRLGLHTGPVIVGHLAHDPQRPYTASGETLRLATRLQQQAAPGTLLLSAATYTLVHAEVQGEAGPALQLDAASGPVSVYAVHGLRHRRGGVVGRGSEIRSPFVGRDQDIALLQTRLAQAVMGQGQVIGIAGEPGMGKSRLLAEFRQHLTGQPVQYYEGHCVAYGQATPYLPVLDILRQCCGITDADPAAVVVTKLHQALQTMGLAPEVEAPVLLPLLDISVEPAQLAGLSPAALKAQAFALLRHLILPTPARPARILAVENAHWIDPTSEEWLASLVERLAGVPLLLLVTYRPGYRPPWLVHSAAMQLALTPLSPDESLRVVQAVPQAARLPAQVQRRIVARGAGNPFFLEELVWAVGDHNTTAQPLALPETVQAVLAARIDRLSRAAKRLLQTAAVIGHDVPVPLLQAVTGLADEALHDGLQLLQAAEFLSETRQLPAPTYTFKHALTREAAYQSLLASTRRQLHQRIAQVLEAQCAGLVETQPAVLAHHYRQSGNMEQAVLYLQRAGAQAVQRSAYAEAVQHLTIGVELLTTLPHTLEHVRHELDMLLPLAEAVRLTQGETSLDYERLCIRAHALCQQLGDTPRLLEVLTGLRKYYEVRGQCQRARELAEQVFTLTMPLQDPDHLAEAHYSLGLTLYYLGELPAARAHFEQRMALYEPRQRGSMVHCLSYMAYLLWVLGYPDQALQRIHEALTVAQAWASPFSVYFALYHTGHIHRLRREVHAVQERNEAAMARAAELGLARWLPMTVHQRGWVLAAQGRHAEGIAQMREGLSALQATGAELAQPRFLALLAEAYGHGGHAEAGLGVVANALAVAHRTGERRDKAEICRVKGELLLQHAVSNASEAETCFQQALALARCQQAKSWELRTAMSLARLWQRQGKRAEAHALLAPIYGWFTEGFDTADLQEAKALLEALA